MPPHLATGDTQTLPALIALLLEEQQSGSIVLLQSMGVGIPVYRHAAAKTQLGCVSVVNGPVMFRRHHTCVADNARAVIS